MIMNIKMLPHKQAKEYSDQDANPMQFGPGGGNGGHTLPAVDGTGSSSSCDAGVADDNPVPTDPQGGPGVSSQNSSVAGMTSHYFQDAGVGGMMPRSQLSHKSNVRSTNPFAVHHKGGNPIRSQSGLPFSQTSSSSPTRQMLDASQVFQDPVVNTAKNSSIAGMTSHYFQDAGVGGMMPRSQLSHKSNVRSTNPFAVHHKGGNPIRSQSGLPFSQTSSSSPTRQMLDADIKIAERRPTETNVFVLESRGFPETLPTDEPLGAAKSYPVNSMSSSTNSNPAFVQTLETKRIDANGGTQIGHAPQGLTLALAKPIDAEDQGGLDTINQRYEEKKHRNKLAARKSKKKKKENSDEESKALAKPIEAEDQGGLDTINQRYEEKKHRNKLAARKSKKKKKENSDEESKALAKPIDAEDQGGLDTINQRYEEKKHRNKLAARKSKKKKKENSDEESKINKELNTIHEQFKVDVKILEDQCRTLRECLDTKKKDNNNWSVPSDNVLDTDDILDYALSLEEELDNIIIDQTTTTGPTNVPTDTDGIGQSAIGIAHSAWTVDGNTDGDGEEEENTDDILDYALSLEEELDNIIIDQTTTTGPTNVPTDTDGIGQSAIGIAHSAWTVDGNTDGDGEEEENTDDILDYALSLEEELDNIIIDQTTTTGPTNVPTDTDGIGQSAIGIAHSAWTVDGNTDGDGEEEENTDDILDYALSLEEELDNIIIDQTTTTGPTNVPTDTDGIGQSAIGIAHSAWTVDGNTDGDGEEEENTDDILDYALSLEEELDNIIIDQTTTTGPTNVPTDTDGIGQSAIGIAHSAWTVDGNTDGDGEEEENELIEFLGKRQ